MRRYDEREIEDFIDRNDTLDSLQVSVSPVDLFILTSHAADYGVDISFTIRNLDTVKSLVLLRGTTKDINTATVVQTYDPSGLKVNDVIKYTDMALELAANECYYWIRAYQNTASANPVDVGFETSRAHNTDTAPPTGFPYWDLSFSAAVGGVMDLYVSFPKNPSPNFGMARVYVSGYHGNPNYVLLADSDHSPFKFKIDATGETVVFSLRAVNDSGTAESVDAFFGTTLVSGGVRPAAIYDMTATALTNGVQLNFIGGLESSAVFYQVDRRPLGGGGAVAVGTVAPGRGQLCTILDPIGLTGKFEWLVRTWDGTAFSGYSPAPATILIFDELYGDITGDATIDGISAALTAHGSVTLWRETFEAAANSLKGYENLVAAGFPSTTFPANGITGGLVFANGGKYVWPNWRKNIPFDPTKLYRMTCKVRKTAGAFGDYFYCGVAGVAADGVTFANITGANSQSNQHYVCAAAVQMVAGSGWQTFVGYFKGNSATAGVPSGADSSKPAAMYTTVRYIRPLFICSYPGDQGTYEVDVITIDVLSDPSTDDLSKKGSTPPSNTPGFTYTSDASSITWSWALTIYRSDAINSTVSPAGSQAITGLGASSTYNFYPYYDEDALVVSMVATGGTGAPSWAHVGTNRVWSAEQSRQNHITLSLSAMPASTTGGGGGGGGGGGDGSCLRGDMFVEAKRGIIRAIDVRAGDYLKSPRGWTRVLSAEPKLHDVFVRVTFSNGDAVVVTDTHPFTLHDGSSKRVYDMCLQDAIPCTTGVAFPTSITLVKERAFKMSINCGEEHVFFAGEIAPTLLTHNMIDPT